MKKAKKIVALLLCAVLLVGASIAGTVAYLTSQDQVVNTFTVGNVQIYLDEIDYDNSKTDPEEGVTGRDKENEYHLLPGHEYDKDPTVTVLANSEECYVRMIMTINKQDELDKIFADINAIRADNGLSALTIADVLTGFDADKWDLFSEKEVGNTRVYEFRYYDVVAKADTNKALEPLFTKVVMPDEITNDQLATLYAEGDNNNLKIDVVAHAIQADGFENADAAWAAFNP